MVHHQLFQCSHIFSHIFSQCSHMTTYADHISIIILHYDIMLLITVIPYWPYIDHMIHHRNMATA